MDFKLILVIVDTERTAGVLKTAIASGATGATILSQARGVGLSKNTSFLGLELFNSRDVVLVLVESRRSEHVLHEILREGRLDESLGTGIALLISVDKAVGLSEHIKLLRDQFPA